MRRFLSTTVGLTLTIAATLLILLDWYEEKRGRRAIR